MKKPKTPSATALSLRALLEEGIILGWWNHYRDALPELGVPRWKLEHHIAGHSGDDQIRQTLEKMRRVHSKRMEQFDLGSLHPKTRKLQEIYLTGITAGKWDCVYVCARCCGVDRASLTKYLRSKVRPENQKRERFIDKMIDCLRRKSPDRPAKQGTKGKEERPVLQPQPGGVIASPWFDRILSGVDTIEGQVLGGVRFALDAECFRPLEGTFTEEELADTQLLIEELIRRLLIIAQLRDQNQRLRVGRGLHESIDRLFRAIDQSREVIPSKTARARHQMHTAFPQGSEK